MKQEKSNENMSECAKHINEEEQLNINELMDVQGGQDVEPIKNCGLGCYLSGLNDTGTTHTEDGPTKP